MPIFDQEPADWENLQSRVAQLFSKLGCDVAESHILELVRGSKEIRWPSISGLIQIVYFPTGTTRGKMPKIKWNKSHVERQQVLIEAYRLLIHLGPVFEMEGYVWQLPMTLPSLDSEGNVEGELVLTSDRQVYDFIDANKDIALKHFQVLYGEIAA